MCIFLFLCALLLSRSLSVGFWPLSLLLLFLRTLLLFGPGSVSPLLPPSFSVLFFGLSRLPSFLLLKFVCLSLLSLLPRSLLVLLLPLVLGFSHFPLLSLSVRSRV